MIEEINDREQSQDQSLSRDGSSTADRLLAFSVAIAGGLAGLIGSFIQELAKNDVLGPFVAGPIIEEALKPSGVYLLLAKWPHLLTSRIFTALLAGVSGLVFGIIENLIYLYIYFPEHSQTLVVVRFTAGLAMHAGCSFIVGLGIDKSLVAGVKGEIPIFSTNKRYFIIPMAIHSAYNITAFALNRFLR